MTVDLRLDISPRYSLISLVFFITYTLFQPPAVVVLRKINPRNFLSIITFSWGVIMIGCAFVNDWTALIGLRVILGVLEAGLFPGCAYILSTWYTRYELQKRTAAFYLIGTVVSAFTNILAYGISKMGGTAGLRGWRWIFIVCYPV
jgi:MFS family permease